MSVRAATVRDLTALIDLGEMLHGSSAYSRFTFDRHKVADLLTSVIKGSGVVFVSEREGQIVGGIAGGVTEFWFGHDVHGFDYSFFVHPDHRHGITAFRLLLAFQEWCRARGASEIRIGITTGIAIEQTTKFYEWCGFVRNGALFTKELSHGN